MDCIVENINQEMHFHKLSMTVKFEVSKQSLPLFILTTQERVLDTSYKNEDVECPNIAPIVLDAHSKSVSLHCQNL